MRLLVTGDRRWTDEGTIYRALSPFRGKDVVVVHGGAAGADSIAEKVAEQLGLDTEVHPANWRRYKRAAGPIRNREMLDSGVAEVFAFHSHLWDSKGTRNCILQALRRGLRVTIHTGA